MKSRGGHVAADLAARLGNKVETARELCYRFHTLCKRKKRAAEALLYNGLLQSWPEIVWLAGELKDVGMKQGTCLKISSNG